MLSCKFGKNYIVEISGGSHEPEMRVVLSGLPADTVINMNQLQQFLARRAPGNSPLSTSRKEADTPFLVKGCEYSQPDTVTVSTDEVLTFAVKNTNIRKKDYNLTIPRPGHADLPAHLKYGNTLNMSGGGPFSGRMTAMLCIAGGIAIQILEKCGITVKAAPLSIGNVKNNELDFSSDRYFSITDKMSEKVLSTKEEKDSLGGIIEFTVQGLPSGLGGPMQDGLEGCLSYILYGIPAVKGVEFGNGFACSTLKGSENNDPILAVDENRKIITETNNHGGILGGISTGMPLTGRIAIKPTPSIGKPQRTINLTSGNSCILETEGRHDPCIVPRAVPVVEAALAIGILDAMLADGLPSELRSSTLKAEAPAAEETELDKCRKEIDFIDGKLKELLDQRMDIAKRVAYYKIENDMEIYHPQREQEILEKVEDHYKDIFAEIMNTSKKIQKNLINNRKEKNL